MIYTLRIVKQGAAVLDGSTLLDLDAPGVTVSSTPGGEITVIVPDGVALGAIDPGSVLERGAQADSGRPYAVCAMSAVSSGGGYTAGTNQFGRTTPTAGAQQNSEVIMDLNATGGLPAGARFIFMSGFQLTMETSVAGPHELNFLMKSLDDMDLARSTVEGEGSAGSGAVASAGFNSQALTTTISAIGTFVDINTGGFVAAQTLSRGWSLSGDKLVYDGTVPYLAEFFYSCSSERTGGGVKRVEMRMTRNGVALDGSSFDQEDNAVSSTLTSKFLVLVQPGDEFVPQIANFTDTNDLIVRSLRMVVGAA